MVQPRSDSDISGDSGGPAQRRFLSANPFGHARPWWTCAILRPEAGRSAYSLLGLEQEPSLRAVR